MSNDLYKILDVDRDATPEQIRKAYRQKALKTHPDRFRGATASETAAAEEQFRHVNNAYEVLNDPETRGTYDQHGVWPPPEPVYASPPSHHSAHSYHRSQREHKYPSNDFQQPFPGFPFTDPFELFDSFFFGERPRHRHRSRTQSHDFPSHLPDGPFERAARLHSNIESLFESLEHDMFRGFGGPPVRSPFPSFFDSFPALDSSPSNGRSNVMSASESFMTQTINGVTQSVHKRVDMNGDEHVVRTFSDGRKVHTINGVEQPTQGYLPPPRSRHSSRHLPPQDMAPTQNYMPPPLPPSSRHSSRRHSPPHDTAPPQNYIMPPPPPPYSNHSQSRYHNGPSSEHKQSRHHSRASSDARTPRYDIYAHNEPPPVIPPAPQPELIRDDTSSKRSWWRRS